MTYDQFIKSLDTIRGLCTPKFKLSKGKVIDLRNIIHCWSLCLMEFIDY